MALKLNEHFEYNVKIFIEDDINLQDYFSFVDKHFSLFAEKKKINENLEKVTNLYTIVQKSLLNKYKVN